MARSFPGGSDGAAARTAWAMTIKRVTILSAVLTHTPAVCVCERERISIEEGDGGGGSGAATSLPMPGSVAPIDLAAVQVPYHFRCPISLELMRDPVTVCTGQTYDRASIESWIAAGNATCPVTRSLLSDFSLIPNHTLRRLIQAWCVANSSLGVERIPTPRQPADPSLIRALVVQAASSAEASIARLSALRRLRSLGVDSDHDLLLISTPDHRASLLSLAFEPSPPADYEVALAALSVISLLPLSEQDGTAVASDPDRLSWLASLLSSHPSVDTRVDAAAMIEAVSAGTRSPDLRVAVGATDGVLEGLVRLLDNDRRRHTSRAAKVAIKAVFSLCLVKQNRQRAVSLRAVESLLDRVAFTDLDRGDLERALAAVELLCRAEGGCEALAAHGCTVAALAKVLSTNVSDRAAEHAAGALVAACGTSEALQREAVAKGVVARLLLMVQSDCTARAKRKAQLLLKLLRAAWPQHDSLVNSDDFQVQPLAAAPFFFC